MKKAKHPYFCNKKAIIPIFFVSILWFLYDAGEWTQKAGNIEQTAPLFSMWQGPIGGDKPSADVWENSTYRL